MWIRGENMLKFSFNLQRFAARGSISVSLLSQSVSNNTSTIRVTYTVTRISGTSYWANAKTVTFNVDGQILYSSINLPSSKTSNSCYVDVTVGHNSDGTKTVYAYAECPVSGVNGTPFGAEANVTLNTIPRKTYCPSLSGDIESTYIIALNPASSNFTHSMFVHFGKIQGYINGNGGIQAEEYIFYNNIPFTIPSSFYNQFNGISGVGTFYLKTYSGGSNIGETMNTFTAFCSESRCRPVINGTVVDSNEKTLALTGDENKIVKYFSNALINITTSPSASVNDDNNWITYTSVDGISFNGNSITLNNVIKKEFTITVTNSRGFSTSITLSVSDLVDYVKPSLILDAYRYPDQTSSNIKMTFSGTFFNQSFGKIDNSLLLKWYWKKPNDNDWTLGGEIDATYDKDKIKEQTIDCGNIFDYQNEYRFKLEIIDKLTSEGTKEVSVLRGKPMYSHGENWFQFHTNVYNSNGNEISNPYPVGSIYLSVDSQNPNELFGGVWEQIKDVFLLACGNKYKNATTGGAETVILDISQIPSHNHTSEPHIGWGSGVYGAGYGKADNNSPGQLWPTGIGYTGGGQPHENMPPYLAVYMWKRIA